MTNEEAFDAAGLASGGEKSQMFGKPCYKIGGKAFLCFFENCAVFKLGGDPFKTAMGFSGSKLFDPSGKGRAMKEWVQVKGIHQAEWKKLAKAACTFVKSKP
jgi:hypothetical protein